MKWVLTIVAVALLPFFLLASDSTTAQYELTVVGGTGSGTYTEPAQVPISAEERPGYLFHQWSGTDAVLAAMEDANSASTVVTLTNNMTVTATFLVDSDEDGVADKDDNCPSVANPSQTDSDTNGVGDSCEGLQDTSSPSLRSLDLAPRLISASSRKTHHAPEGPIDCDLPLSLGHPATVEGRYNWEDMNCDLQLVLRFSDTIVAADGTIDANEFNITNGELQTASSTGRELVIHIRVPRDPACVNVMLQGLVDATGQYSLTGDKDINIIALAGDVNGDGLVNDTDHSIVESHLDTPVDQSSFRADIDMDGQIAACWDGNLIAAFSCFHALNRFGCAPDSDLDGIRDESDNCILDSNHDQTDSDADGIGDSCDICSDGNDLADGDGDGVPDHCDNCPAAFNFNQSDSDDDGWGDVCDNCARTHNPDQGDTDQDGRGDACDYVGQVAPVMITSEPPLIHNPQWIPPFRRPSDEVRPYTDTELLEQIDAHTAEYLTESVVLKQTHLSLPTTRNTLSELPSELAAVYDRDLDGDVDQDDFAYFQACFSGPDIQTIDGCFEANLDSDTSEDVDRIDMELLSICYSGPDIAADAACGDCNRNGVYDTFEIRWCDTCGGADLDQDNDMILDDCDNCRDLENGFLPDTCIPGSGSYDEIACPDATVYLQADIDHDGVGDACDNCRYVPNADQSDVDEDGVGDVCSADADADGIPNGNDNCPLHQNTDQTDGDSDGMGDVCDNCPGIANVNVGAVDCNNDEDTEDAGEGHGEQCDQDGDGVGDACDNCPTQANGPLGGLNNQGDIDEDGEGDICDEDDDGDGISDIIDNCPSVANVNVGPVDCNNDQDTNDAGEGDGEQCDRDTDGIGDACDNCPDFIPNPEQTDTDNDGIGDLCDNCPETPNADQADSDHDGNGNLCDPGPVDLDIDSDNNDANNPPARTEYEDAIEQDSNLPGKIVWVNEDDDNRDGQPDKDLDGAIPEEDDLAPVVLQIQPTNPIAFSTIHYYWDKVDSQQVRLWPSPQRGDIDTDPIEEDQDHTYEVLILGDMNHSGELTSADLDAFDDLLSDLSAYKDDYGWQSYTDAQVHNAGDINGDGTFDQDDRPYLQFAITSGSRACVPVRFWCEGIDESSSLGHGGIRVAADLDGDGIKESEDQVRITFPSPEACSTAPGPYDGGVPIGSNCQDQPLTEGRCIHSRACHGNCTITEGGIAWLGIDLRVGFGPADLPPRKTDPWLSSSPIVSREAYHSSGVTAYRERAAHNDIVDFATGSPLIQDIDFELPFGGAVFRHVRTYAETPTWHPEVFDREPWPAFYHDQGTNGIKWHMSETPTFLIDAQYCWNHDEPKKCYLIPDAHHAIPFTYNDAVSRERLKPVYLAPPGFDAIIDNNGIMDAEGTIVSEPTEFHIWLHQRSVRYTFEVHRDGTPQERHIPETFGACKVPDTYAGGPIDTNGVPYYGLVTRIEDRYGNAMLFEYCGLEQWNCDQTYSDLCMDCCQSCNQIGQLKSLKLVSNVDTTTEEVIWTLVYTYRTFASEAFDDELCDSDYGPDGEWIANSRLLPHYLHSIHVYEGDRSVPYNCLNVKWQQLAYATSLDVADEVNHEWIDVNDDWTLEVRYTYDEFGRYEDPTEECDGFAVRQAYIGGAEEFLDGPATLWQGGHLLKTRVTRRSDNQSHSSYRMYRYAKSIPPDCPSGTTWWSSTVLRTIFDEATIDAILRGMHVDANHANATVNDLLSLPSNYAIPFTNPETGSIETDVLGNLATVTLLPPDSTETPAISDATHQYLASLFGGNPNKAFLKPRGKTQLLDRRSTSQQDGVFRYYFYTVYPDTYSKSTGGTAQTHEPDPWNMHYPYRIITSEGSGFREGPYTYEYLSAAGPEGQPPVFHVCIVDELHPIANPSSYDPTDTSSLRSRRIVEMNPAGWVIRDRTWRYSDNDGQIVQQTGFAELNSYDSQGRIKERRTTGWNTLPEAEQGNKGLVYVYEYFDDYGDSPGELKAIGVKQGTEDEEGGASRIRYVEAYHRDIPSRPELVTKQIQFREPVSDFANYQPDQAEIIETTYGFFDGDTDNGIETKAVKQPAEALTRNGTPQYAIERIKYDARGNPEWSGTGTLTDPVNPVAGPYFFVNHQTTDHRGRLTAEVHDTSETAPLGFARAATASVGTALNLTTSYDYHSVYGLKRTVFPNGREQHIAYLKDSSNNQLQQWTFNDLQEVDNYWEALSPGEIRIYEGSHLIKTLKVKFTSISELPDGDNDEYVVLSETTPQYDKHGRLAGVQQADGDEAALSAGIGYDGTGNIARQREPDGTITRHVYDELGRLQRTYQGTEDTHEYWGTDVPLCQDGEDPQEDNCHDPSIPYDDNLTLIEKRYYGESVNDAGQLIEVRHFRDQPVNQYSVSHDGSFQPLDPTNEDNIGWVTRHYYDWRMREAWVEQQDSSGTTVNHTLTWYDNLDRIRLVAEYGPDLTLDPETDGDGLLDPTEVGVDGTLPTPETLLTAAVKSLSLTEKVYNRRGQVAEARNYYDLAESTARYTATLTYYNHTGQPVEIHTPGGAVRRYEYDAKNRQIWSWTIAAGVETAKTRTVYDSNDNAIQMIHWERKPGDTASTPLDDNNGIKTYNYTWYDKTGRVLATAGFGTNTANNTYTNGSAPDLDEDDQSNPPITFDGNDDVIACLNDAFGTDVPITCYSYDESGNQDAVFNPDGTVTRHTYDGLKRLLLTVENADAVNSSDETELDNIRQTAYRYDDRGRLDMMAHVDWQNNEEFGLYNRIVWEKPEGDDSYDGTIQVTRFVYGAEVVDQSGATISQHEGWISEVHYPDPATGWPSDAPSLTFKYYSDGAVAFRQDAKGGSFAYHYDELGRLDRTEITSSRWVAAGVTLPDAAPPALASIHYTYTPDGLLQWVTAKNASGSILYENKFEYDDFRHLIQEHQSHSSAVIPGTTPAVDYSWAFSPVDAYNFNRITGITYPARPSNATRRQITFDYGNNTDDLHSAMGHITAISDASVSTNPVATYAYMGFSRRVGLSLANGVSHSAVDAANEPAGLDRFGRLADLHFKNGVDTVHRYQYGYDRMGNRLFARATQADAGGLSHDNDRSWLYVYDGLNRLENAHLGRLDANNNAILTTDPDVALRRQIAWALDPLGRWCAHDKNWQGRAFDGVYFYDDTDADGSPDWTDNLYHEVNHANELTATWHSDPNRPNLTMVHDPAGNIVFDGQYVYQYDAWNRLIEVNEAGMFDTGDFAPDGRIHPDDQNNPIHEIGQRVAVFTYDGLGRLITFDNGQHAIHYYYDGVRRLQETNDAGTPADPADDLTDHEYVHGPDYVDEFVFATYRDSQGNQQPLYVLQDANYNVMALVNTSGNVVEQYVWEPYGQLAFKDTQGAPAPDFAIGHQGLFFYRFDTGPTLSPDAIGLYHNRNRWYAPTLGRFTTRDPISTGRPTTSGPTDLGLSPAVTVALFSGDDHFASGFNAYDYLGSNPVVRVDIGGTRWAIPKCIQQINVTYSAGSFLGGLYAAQLLDVKNNRARMMFAATAGMAMSEAWRIGKRSIKGFWKPELTWEATMMTSWEKGLNTLSGGLKEALDFLVGYRNGMIATTMYVISEDIHEGQATYLPGL